MSPDTAAQWVAEALASAPEPTEAQLARVAALLGLGSSEAA